MLTHLLYHPQVFLHPHPPTFTKPPPQIVTPTLSFTSISASTPPYVSPPSQIFTPIHGQKTCVYFWGGGVWLGAVKRLELTLNMSNPPPIRS